MARYDVAVLGAGVAGLAAAALIAMSKRKVIVFDREERPGGLMASQEVQGMCFAPGPGATYGFERGGSLFLLSVALGMPVAPSPGPSAFQVVLPGRRITVSSEMSETLEELRREFPREIDRAARMYREARSLRERSATSGTASFLVRRRSAARFLGAYGFSRELMSFLSVQARYFFGQPAETLRLADLLLMVGGAPPLLKDGAQGVADRLREVLVAAGGVGAFDAPWPELSLQKGRIASLRCGDGTVDARTVLLNLPDASAADALFLSVRRQALPVGMKPTVLALADYERPQDIVAVTIDALQKGSGSPEEVVPLTASFLPGGVHHDPQRDRLIDRVRTLMPFVDEFVTASHERDCAVRQVPLPFELSASLTAAGADALLYRPKTASNVYVLPDSTSSLTRAAYAGQRAARKLA